MKAGTPLFGICLGSQLIARALGARVYRSEHPEFGFKRILLNAAGMQDPVLGALGGAEASFTAIQWHDDAWDLPQGAELLASDAAWPNQAFRYGSGVLATQFHLEFTQPHMAWAVQRPEEPASKDPEGEDPLAFSAPSPRYDRLRLDMESVLDAALAYGRGEAEALLPEGAVAASKAAR